MDKLGPLDTLLVSQKKELGEVITGFEMRNRYVVRNSTGTDLYYAVEQSSLLLRWFLRALRPFTILILDMQGKTVLRLVRSFRFYFHKVDIYDGADRLLGSIERRFSFIRRIYSVIDSRGKELFQLFGPILHPWTFNILRGDTEIGKIAKRWTGLLKETFTDADNFGVGFPQDLEISQKALVLGGVFLVDFVHFENRGDRG
jgi:uncharacterized protein YxjI